MNVLKLNQKQGFNHYEYILTDKFLSVKQSSLLVNKSYVVALENLGHKRIKKKDSGIMKISVSLFLLLSSFFFITINAYDHSKHMSTWLWMAIGILYGWLSTLMLLSPQDNELRLTNGNEDLVLLTDKPSEKEVNEFVDEIIKRSRDVILKKYGTVDADLPEKLMISHLNWLLQIGVIDNDEFNKKRAQYFTLKQD
jgi:hypothetical protein